MSYTMVSPFQEIEIVQAATDSSEIDLGAEFRDVQVFNPAIDSNEITVYPIYTSGDITYQAWRFNEHATGDHANTTTARALPGMSLFKDICARYVQIHLSAGTAGSATTWYIRGVGRLGA